MATQELNWGDPIEEFPSGEFFEGDFDGTITSIIYETNYSRFQITVSINPAEPSSSTVGKSDNFCKLK